MPRYFRPHPEDRAQLDKLWLEYDIAVDTRDALRRLLRDRIEDCCATLYANSRPDVPPVLRADEYPIAPGAKRRA